MAASAGTWPSYAALVSELPASFVPYGTTATCLDAGMVYSNGVTWWSVGSGSGGTTPVFSKSIASTLATSQDNYSPAGYIAGTTNRLILTPNASGSTLNGLVAASDGWSVALWNDDLVVSASIEIPNENSSTAANQFLTANNGTTTIESGSGCIISYYAAGPGWIFLS